MSVIKLNFINKSNDVNQSKVVISQKHVNPDYNEAVIAWIVIEHCGQGDHHPFKYDTDLKISASDSYGNCTPRFDAKDGQLFEMVEERSGNMLRYKGPGSSSKEIQVVNNLSMGAINVNCFRSGKLVDSKRNVVPGQMAVFYFKPYIYIGVLSDAEEGKALDSAVMSQVNTEISLLGLKSADIVMRGGGFGRSAMPYTFHLENIVMA